MKTFPGELVLPDRKNQKAFLQGLFFSRLRANSSIAIAELGKLIPLCEALLRSEKIEKIGPDLIDRRPLDRAYKMLTLSTPEELHGDACTLWHRLKQWQLDFHLTADWCRQRAIADIMHAAIAFIFGDGVTEDEWKKGSEFYDLTLWPMLSASAGIEIYNKVRDEIQSPEGWHEYQPLNWTRKHHFDLNIRPAIESHLDANCYTRDDKIYGAIKDWRKEFIIKVWKEKVEPYCIKVESAYIQYGCIRVHDLRAADEHISLTVKARLMGKNVKWDHLAKDNRKRKSAGIDNEKRRIQKAVREMLLFLDLPLEPTILRGMRGRRGKGTFKNEKI